MHFTLCLPTLSTDGTLLQFLESFSEFQTEKSLNIELFLQSKKTLQHFIQFSSMVVLERYQYKEESSSMENRNSWLVWINPNEIIGTVMMVYLFLLLMVQKTEAWLMTENFGISIFAEAMKE